MSNWIAEWLEQFSWDRPARVIATGERPYMYRIFLGEWRGWCAYLHHFVEDDAERWLHDHPFHSLAIVLTGGYEEERLQYLAWPGLKSHYRKVRWLNLILGGTFHRIVGLKPGTWTLFLHRPKHKGWGFLEVGKDSLEAMPNFEGLVYKNPFGNMNNTKWWLDAPTYGTLRIGRAENERQTSEAAAGMRKAGNKLAEGFGLSMVPFSAGTFTTGSPEPVTHEQIRTQMEGMLDDIEDSRPPYPPFDLEQRYRVDAIKGMWPLSLQIPPSFKWQEILRERDFKEPATAVEPEPPIELDPQPPEPFVWKGDRMTHANGQESRLDRRSWQAREREKIEAEPTGVASLMEYFGVKPLPLVEPPMDWSPPKAGEVPLAPDIPTEAQIDDFLAGRCGFFTEEETDEFWRRVRGGAGQFQPEDTVGKPWPQSAMGLMAALAEHEMAKDVPRGTIVLASDLEAHTKPMVIELNPPIELPPYTVNQPKGPKRPRSKPRRPRGKK